mmetsp:Transcript_10666/g.25540  ORF Transcript_10666/g.25540 Transcript_10666/m.25540 type:complete len:109 (-) Transcript_10666:1228-1554(-)
MMTIYCSTLTIVVTKGDPAGLNVGRTDLLDESNSLQFKYTKHIMHHSRSEGHSTGDADGGRASRVGWLVRGGARHNVGRDTLGGERADKGRELDDEPRLDAHVGASVR